MNTEWDATVFSLGLNLSMLFQKKKKNGFDWCCDLNVPWDIRKWGVGMCSLGKGREDRAAAFDGSTVTDLVWLAAIARLPLFAAEVKQDGRLLEGKKVVSYTWQRSVAYIGFFLGDFAPEN